MSDLGSDGANALPARALRSKRQSIHGWGHYPVEECSLYRPERFSELAEVVASAEEPSLIARGLGRSYGDASLNGGGGVVLSERLDRILDFDRETGVVWCEAAVSLAELIDVFLPQGYFFPVTPGTKWISLGGAIAADVHGKNHHRDGSLSNWLEEFRLLTASGEVLRCSREENADVFWATAGGMGLTGIVLDARLRLKKIDTGFVNVDYEKAPNLDAALESFLLRDEAYDYSVAWIDTMASGSKLGRSVLMRANFAGESDLPANRRGDRRFEGVSGMPSVAVPFHFPSATLNNWTLKLFNEFFWGVHRDGRVLAGADRFFYPLDTVHHWNRVYGTQGAIQYQAVIPPPHEREGLAAMLELLSRKKLPSFLAVLKPFGPKGDGLLSFPRPGYTLSIDLPVSGGGGDFPAIARELDEVVLRFGGSVYLAKDSCLHPDSIESMYPQIATFRDVLQRVDPERRFQSSLSRRLELAGKA